MTFVFVRIVSPVAAITLTLAVSACGRPAASSSLAFDGAGSYSDDFVLQHASYKGRIAKRSGMSDSGAAYTYAGEFDKEYTKEEHFDRDVAILVDGLPAIDGTYRIFSTHANRNGANLFANPAAIESGDVIIYNACNAAAGSWALNQAVSTGAVVFATDGTVSEGVSDGDWFKHLADGTWAKELPPGTNYGGKSASQPGGATPPGNTPALPLNDCGKPNYWTDQTTTGACVNIDLKTREILACKTEIVNGQSWPMTYQRCQSAFGFNYTYNSYGFLPGETCDDFAVGERITQEQVGRARLPTSKGYYSIRVGWYTGTAGAKHSCEYSDRSR